MSTGFDIQSLDFLKILELRDTKSSGEITNLPYLRKISTFRKPVIMSTGMSNLDEIDKALSIFLEEGIKNDLTILHCTTQYPTLVEDVNSMQW